MCEAILKAATLILGLLKSLSERSAGGGGIGRAMPHRAARWMLQGLIRSLTGACVITLGGCGVLHLGFLNAAGPVAGGERHLFLILAFVLIFVAGPVLILTPLFAWHYRLSNRHRAYRPKWTFSWPLEGFIWIPPIVIVIGLAVLLWTGTHRFDPYRRIDGATAPIEIEAVALDWKWLFIYPDQHLATVNELDIPAGRPVRLHLTSATVMQSMLLPRLAGQIYAMAGMSTELNFAADRPGVYKGENTQYNGDGFQAESFAVVAMAPADYQRWAERVRRAAQPLDAAAYQRLSQKSVEPKPLVFSPVPPGLYEHILMMSGGGAHSHPEDGR
jgi:cytochrome o ubiquinol oxidase subunit 2